MPRRVSSLWAIGRGFNAELLDIPGTVADQAHFGLARPAPFAAATMTTELAGSALVLVGWLRWLGARRLAGFTLITSLIANAFRPWPPGAEWPMAANGFFEHPGLVGGFLLVAVHELRMK